MKVIRGIREISFFLRDVKAKGKSIALVPTMGALHSGHLELVREARALADIVILTIFVNPTQFSAGEDLESYPQDIDSDLEKARGAGVDVVFTPAAKEMYPDGFQTEVSICGLQEHLCGLSRPGHFTGVATVVLKLFNITAPDWAVFGEKDFQQLLIIRQMTRDLNLGVEIIGVDTVREPDGLAMSSRNRYLSKEEREAAAALPRALQRAAALYREGEQEAGVLISAVEEILRAQRLIKPEYVKVVDASTLENITFLSGRGAALIQAAVQVGRARLIDHILI
ncbi:MAG: pantoate--beta-alanine ligase [Thermodesulfobacteriota bacterium]